MIVDYHMHLRDRDGDEPGGRYPFERLELYVEHARRAGVDEIGFSDHAYHFEQVGRGWPIPWMCERCGDDLDEYVGTIANAKAQGLPIKLGLEVDYVEGCEEWLPEVLAGYEWDYLLGSVHFVDGRAVDVRPALIDEVGPERAWTRYFQMLALGARSGLFDVLAHPDLVKIFGPRPEEAIVSSEQTALVRLIHTTGVCLEVSSAGLHKPVGEVYPDLALLAMANEHGMPITLASDAHAPEHVGRDVAQAVRQARAAGYETVTVFERRVGRQEPLG